MSAAEIPLILNVDDDEAGRYAKSRILTLAGLRVAEAGTGMEALRLVDELDPALVLLDVKLPDINGIEVCRRIKAGWPGMLVLQISVAMISGADRVRGLEGGADSYLTQPVAPEELLAVIRALLRLREAEREARQLNATLEARVAERTAEIAAANARLTAEIAERERAEAAAESLYRRAPLPLHSLDSAGRLLAVSDRWLEFFGYAERRQVIGRPITDFLAEQSIQEFRGTLWPRVLKATQLEEAELRMLRSNRMEADMLVSITVVRDERGRFLRSIAALVDVTARRIAEERLRQSQKMEVFGQLAGGIAHDMNNVLQTVVSGTRILGLQAQDPEAVRRLAGLMAEAAERGAAVARRLLTFARRGELRASAVDIAQLMRDMQDVLAHTLGGRIETRLGAVPEPGTVAVFADRHQFETVLLNLAVNARDAMPEGGIVTISAALQRSPPGHLPTGWMVALSLSDQGSGMDEATLARATEPFFTTKPQGQGTGLGLAMARSFAEQSGGRLLIRSAPQSGTTVTLCLPLHQVEAAAGAADAAPPPMPPPGAQLIVVDDDPLVRSMLATVFVGFGQQVAVCEDAAAAIGLLQQQAPCDLLLTDLAMPGTSGLELLREARRLRPALPCILLTGNLEEEATAALAPLAEGGPFMVLRKPMAAPELGAAVGLLLARRG